MQKATSSAPAAVREFLSFTLGREEYGIDIKKVKEIRGYSHDDVTHIPNSPDFLIGVTNLRGEIVPIIDLRVKFNIKQVDYDTTTVVIILNILDRLIGVVVDTVRDVIPLTDEQVKPAGGINSVFKTQYLIGFGSIKDTTRGDATDDSEEPAKKEDAPGNRLLVLIDIELLMSSADMELIEKSVPE